MNVSLWMMAIRPKTLSAAIAPILIATAMAFGDGVHHFPSAFLCLTAAILIQIGTNLANDYYDFKHGADTEERIGPKRVTQSGLISPKAVFLSFIVTFLMAAAASFFLVLRGGQPILIILILSILSGIFYTAGPRPLGYMGLGDLFVLIFFGPVAVGGTYYVQSFEINMAVILAGLGPGFISVAILTVNNLRDCQSDRKTGKKTLAVRFGENFARCEYLTVLLLAGLIPVIIFLLIHDHRQILWAAVTPLVALPGICSVFTSNDGPALNSTLAFTGKVLLLYSVIFSMGWLS